MRVADGEVGVDDFSVGHRHAEVLFGAECLLVELERLRTVFEREVRNQGVLAFGNRFHGHDASFVVWTLLWFGLCERGKIIGPLRKFISAASRRLRRALSCGPLLRAYGFDPTSVLRTAPSGLRPRSHVGPAAFTFEPTSSIPRRPQPRACVDPWTFAVRRAKYGALPRPV